MLGTVGTRAYFLPGAYALGAVTHSWAIPVVPCPHPGAYQAVTESLLTARVHQSTSLEKRTAPRDHEEGDPEGQGPVMAAGACLVACFLPAWSKVRLGFPRKTGWTLDPPAISRQFSLILIHLPIGVRCS